MDLLVLSTWGGSNKTVHPTSSHPRGQVHTSWLAAVKAPQLISIQQYRPRTVRRPSVEKCPVDWEGKQTPADFSPFESTELRVVQLSANSTEDGQKFISSNMSGLCHHRQTLDRKWRKSIFDKSGKVVALKCYLAFQAVNATTSQYLSLGSFMLS